MRVPFASIEHRTVVDNPDVTNPVCVWQEHALSAIEIFYGVAILPHQHQAQIAWHQNSIVYIPINQGISRIDVQAGKL